MFARKMQPPPGKPRCRRQVTRHSGPDMVVDAAGVGRFLPAKEPQHLELALRGGAHMLDPADDFARGTSLVHPVEQVGARAVRPQLEHRRAPIRPIAEHEHAPDQWIVCPKGLRKAILAPKRGFGLDIGEACPGIGQARDHSRHRWREIACDRYVAQGGAGNSANRVARTDARAFAMDRDPVGILRDCADLLAQARFAVQRGGHRFGQAL